MTLRLDGGEQAALKAMAEREGPCQHEAARRAIMDRAEGTGVHEAVAAPDDGAYDLVIGVAEDRYDVPAIASRLTRWVPPPGQ